MSKLAEQSKFLGEKFLAETAKREISEGVSPQEGTDPAEVVFILAGVFIFRVGSGLSSSLTPSVFYSTSSLITLCIFPLHPATKFS